MKFAPHYKPVESTPQLPTGLYEAVIVKAEYKKYKSGDTFIEATVEIAEHIGAKPNLFRLNDEPKKDNPKFPLDKQIESYNRNLTRFFDGFGITRGDFNLQNWIGKTGKITVHPQNNSSGYMEITPFELSEKEIKNREEKAEESKKRAEENKKAFESNPQVQYAPQIPMPPSLDNFPEQIPY